LALALHSSAPASLTNTISRNETGVDGDLKFLRTLFPAVNIGSAIVAVSRDAWDLGVRPGMPLAEARSMARPLTTDSHASPRRNSPTRFRPTTEKSSVPDSGQRFTNLPVGFHEWMPTADRSALKMVAEISRRYAPVVGMDTTPMPDSLLLDITGCGPLFGGEAGLAESLLRDMTLAGWSVRIAIADTIPAVWALTHTEGTRYELPIQIVPPVMQLQELAQLPIASSRISITDLEILTRLGIHTIGQLLALPHQDLPSRLSKVAVERICQLTSVTDEFIDPLPEANPVAATWSSESPANSFDDIRRMLKHLVENVAEQIERRRVACSVLDCDLTCANGNKLALSASVVKPTQSPELMFEVLSLRLETSGLSDPVSAISITARIVPIPASRQLDLFSPLGHIRPQEELAALIARLSNRMGLDSVSIIRMQADPRPEHSISLDAVISSSELAGCQRQAEQILQRLTEVDADVTHNTEGLLPRPLRLLATPQQIAGGDDENRFPDRILVLGGPQRIVELIGPERIQTAWWTALPCHRDYYRAIMDTGSQFWIFRELQTGCWFLHGIFD
jgi:protein ImuB